VSDHVMIVITASSPASISTIFRYEQAWVYAPP
jgi:hypothetical protein